MIYYKDGCLKKKAGWRIRDRNSTQLMLDHGPEVLLMAGKATCFNIHICLFAVGYGQLQKEILVGYGSCHDQMGYGVREMMIL